MALAFSAPPRRSTCSTPGNASCWKDLPALASAAGFAAVETGQTDFTDVGYVRARVDG